MPFDCLVQLHKEQVQHQCVQQFPQWTHKMWTTIYARMHRIAAPCVQVVPQLQQARHGGCEACCSLRQCKVVLRCETCRLLTPGMLYLVHEIPEVLLNLEAQLLDILLKQGLLFPRGKGLVVCSALRVLAQLCLPILTGVDSMFKISWYKAAPQLHKQSETVEQHPSFSTHLVLPTNAPSRPKAPTTGQTTCQSSSQSQQTFP